MKRALSLTGRWGETPSWWREAAVGLPAWSSRRCVGPRLRGLTFRLGDRGVGAVEFALICPFVILLLFATIEFGNVWRVQNELQTVAKEAARQVATGALSTNAVETFVRDRLPDPANQEVVVDVDELATDDKQRTDIQVSLSVSLDKVLLLGDWFLATFGSEPGSRQLQASATKLKG
jgi:Flp pilus assembly protein TadG